VYETESKMLTEHAVLSDSAVARSVSFGAARGPVDPRALALVTARQDLEAQVATLRGKKDSMSPAAYDAELERLLVQVAEKTRAINATLATLNKKFMIACGCADTGCIETIEILPQEYFPIRAEPRQFAVLPGHVYPDVESVVREGDGYAVVEKEGEAAEVAEALHRLTQTE